jgi:hypothetical protein
VIRKRKEKKNGRCLKMRVYRNLDIMRGVQEVEWVGGGSGFPSRQQGRAGQPGKPAEGSQGQPGKPSGLGLGHGKGSSVYPLYSLSLFLSLSSLCTLSLFAVRHHLSSTAESVGVTEVLLWLLQHHKHLSSDTVPHLFVL